jgi:hypothetical protein
MYLLRVLIMTAVAIRAAGGEIEQGRLGLRGLQSPLSHD